MGIFKDIGTSSFANSQQPKSGSFFSSSGDIAVAGETREKDRGWGKKIDFANGHATGRYARTEDNT